MLTNVSAGIKNSLQATPIFNSFDASELLALVCLEAGLLRQNQRDFLVDPDRAPNARWLL